MFTFFTRALSTMALATVLVMAFAGAAAAGGAAGTGCPKAFEGLITIGQHRSLPRSVAGLQAGAYDVSFLDEGFTKIDHNANGLICYQVPPGSEKAAEASQWQYLYNIIDDQAAPR